MAGTIVLVGFCHLAWLETPRTPAFFRGINLNGPPVVIDGPRWEGGDSRNLKARDLHPAPEADRLTLIRRLSFDLTGLPPEPEEVERFINDHDERAYEKRGTGC